MEKECHADISCWFCVWHKSSPLLLFGNCTYFETIGKEKKEIPATVCDVGCKFFKSEVPY